MSTLRTWFRRLLDAYRSARFEVQRQIGRNGLSAMD